MGIQSWMNSAEVRDIKVGLFACNPDHRLCIEQSQPLTVGVPGSVGGGGAGNGGGGGGGHAAHTSVGVPVFRIDTAP